MTWWDHETASIWSQPVGQAIEGQLTGTGLELLPLQLTTWGNWKLAHPETWVMINDLDRINNHHQEFQDYFVIGLVLGKESKAYHYVDVQKNGIISDSLGDYPVLIWADGNDYRIYLRVVDEKVLTFRLENEFLVDTETQSRWDLRLGIAVDGHLKGEGLQQVPAFSSYDWVWEDFYPESEIFDPTAP